MGEGGAIPEVVALRHWCQHPPSASLTSPSPQNRISGVGVRLIASPLSIPKTQSFNGFTPNLTNQSRFLFRVVYIFQFRSAFVSLQRTLGLNHENHSSPRRRVESCLDLRRGVLTGRVLHMAVISVRGPAC